MHDTCPFIVIVETSCISFGHGRPATASIKESSVRWERQQTKGIGFRIENYSMQNDECACYPVRRTIEDGVLQQIETDSSEDSNSSYSMHTFSLHQTYIYS